MDISIVVVSWNRRELVLDCLSALETACGNRQWELIVVDNGSTDGTPDAVGERYPRATIIKNGRNLGFAKAVNRALACARGRYAALVNSDAQLQPQALATLVGYLDAHPRAAVAGGQLLHHNGRPQNAFDSFPTLTTELGNKSVLRFLFPRRFPSKRRLPTQACPVDIVIGACFVVRMDAIAEVGPLDESFFFYMEEADWCRRFQQAGWQVIHHPGARIVHLQGQSARPVLAGARIEFYRSRYLYFRKHHPAWKLPVLRIGLLGKILLNLLGQTVTGCVSAHARQTAAVQWALLRWHLAGCPNGPGLPRT